MFLKVFFEFGRDAMGYDFYIFLIYQNLYIDDLLLGCGLLSERIDYGKSGVGSAQSRMGSIRGIPAGNGDKRRWQDFSEAKKMPPDGSIVQMFQVSFPGGRVSSLPRCRAWLSFC